MNKILQGDCLIKLKELEDNSVDSIVTDPPYGLVSIQKRFGKEGSAEAQFGKDGSFQRLSGGFMGKQWDGSGIEYNIDMWKECLRVLKPGGHLLSFGGTRTYHRMACAIEDAGFEIRDMVEWVYGSGFPKSLNIGKAVDKLQGNEREITGSYKVPDIKGDAYGTMNEKQGGSYKNIEVNKTKGTSEWEGFGTALKPAHEPICMARKPLEAKTVAENCLKWGTGGIDIDGSRVGTEEMKAQKSGKTSRAYQSEEMTTAGGIGEDKIGRFPANLIHDGSDEVKECFPETKSGKIKPYTENPKNPSSFNFVGREKPVFDYADSGNASRFFKSIKQDLHCSLCYDTIDPYQLTKNICNNTNVNNVEKSSETTQAIIESTALKNATGKVNENLVQNVKSAGNLCDLCGTSIAQRLVAIMQDQSQESTLGELSMPEHKRQILEKCLVSFVELMGNTDTIPTMENLNLLFGYVLNAIEEYTQKCEDTKSKDKNQWKSLIYKSKASKSERNKGCEDLEEKVLYEEYLIKMITPKGGIVLDPFAGSGSTLVAAKQNGFKYIGIELTEEYIPIIEARLNTITQLTLL